MNQANQERRAELQRALAALPRADLAMLPTPLEPCTRLSQELGGAALWIKRDDLTGLAMGGNKTRMFEYVLGRAVAAGADTVVAGAAVQSNYCRQLAASCARLGLECHLVLRKVRGARDEEIQGGLLLDLLVGAQVTLVDDAGSWAQHGELVRDKGRELQDAGRNVMVARVGDESGLDLYAAAYAAATLELVDQADAAGLRIDQIWLCSSDTTQAGMAMALACLESPIRLVGLPAMPDPVSPGWTFEQCFAQTATACGQLLNLDVKVTPDMITSILDYVGAGYAQPTDASAQALQLVGRLEGILLDPVYTAKAMAGLIDHVRRGLIDPGQNVVFLHTGGLPALFAYADTLGLEPLLSSAT